MDTDPRFFDRDLAGTDHGCLHSRVTGRSTKMKPARWEHQHKFCMCSREGNLKFAKGYRLLLKGETEKEGQYKSIPGADTTLFHCSLSVHKFIDLLGIQAS